MNQDPRNPHVNMAKARLQIALPEDPFYDVKENRSPDKTGVLTLASPKPLKTPKTSRSRERRLECLQWALETAQEQQVALLGGARAQLEGARAHAAHLEGQVAALQGQLAYVAECRHAEHSTYQSEVGKLRSEKTGLMHENEVLADLISSHAKEHEAKLADLVSEHLSERADLVKEQRRLEDVLAKQKGDAVGEVQSFKVALDSAQIGATKLEAERDELQKEARSLRKERDSAVAEARGLKADLANAQQSLKKLTKEKEGDLKASKMQLAACRSELESVRKENERVRKEAESAQREAEGVGRKVDDLRNELERERRAGESAVAEAEKAEGARARARKDLEAALTRMVESRRARAALQRELAETLEALDGVKRHHVTVENESREKLAALGEEVRRLREAASLKLTSAYVEKTSAGGGQGGSQAGNGGQGLSQGHRPPANGNGNGKGNVIVSGGCAPGGIVRGRDEGVKRGGSVLAEQSGLRAAVPAFELGRGDCQYGSTRNPVAERRKIVVARRPGRRADAGANQTGVVSGEPRAAVMEKKAGQAAGTSTAVGSSLTRLEASGCQVENPSTNRSRLDSGSDDGTGVCRSSVGLESFQTAERSQSDLPVCSTFQAPRTGEEHRGVQQGFRMRALDTKRGSKAARLRRVVGCLKKQIVASALFGAAMSPVEERRGCGCARSGRSLPRQQVRPTGRLQRESARQFVSKVLPALLLAIEQERFGF